MSRIGNATMPPTMADALPMMIIFRRPTRSDRIAPAMVVAAKTRPPMIPIASTVVRGRPSSWVP